MTKIMTSKHAFDYGEAEICGIVIEKIFKQAGLSSMDMEIMLLRFGFDWPIEDIAKHIGQKYHDRTDDSPLWEGTIRYRIKIIHKSLDTIVKDLRQIDKNPHITNENA